MTKVFFRQGFSKPNQPTDGHNRSTRFQDGQASASRERNARKQGNKKAGDQKKQSHTLITSPAVSPTGSPQFSRCSSTSYRCRRRRLANPRPPPRREPRRPRRSAAPPRSPPRDRNPPSCRTPGTHRKPRGSRRRGSPRRRRRLQLRRPPPAERIHLRIPRIPRTRRPLAPAPRRTAAWARPG